MKWDQKIILIGKFVSPVKLTNPGPGEPHIIEPYREFLLTDIKVAFPLSLWVDTDPGSVASPTYLETHFGFGSLFPQGVRHRGKLIDLSQHVGK